MNATKVFSGVWRIVELEGWNQEALDLLGPAHLKFGKDGLGNFRFIAVKGDMDCRFTEREGTPLVEFSWTGYDDSDPANGRGWAVVDGESMTGRFFFHCGDEAAFVAKKE